MNNLLKENRELYSDAVKLVKSMKNPTVVSLQRRFNIGYGCGMNLVDVMKERGDWPARRTTPVIDARSKFNKRK